MLDQIRFYLRHSLNDLRVNGQRTLFALLCIAAGVAAIVSLQTLGVMIDDSLTTSLQTSNGGDIKLLPVDEQDFSSANVQQGRDAGVLATSQGGTIGGHRDEVSSTFFSPVGVGQITDWFNDRYPGSEITYRQTLAGGHGPVSMTSVSDLDTEKEQMFVSPFIVDASAYPLYGERLDEDDEPLNRLLQSSTDIVISRRLADSLDAKIGDTIRVSGATQDFTLRGIMPADAESGFDNIGGSLFGFFYLDHSAGQHFDDDSLGIDQIFIKLPDPTDQLDAADAAFAADYPYLSINTTADLEEQNTEVSDILNQLITIMGLVSLLIGGIGIINTMQVVVSRRTNEIAVLKTLGLEGQQVTLLFMTEAILMGIIGSIIGIGLGWFAAYAIKGIAGSFIAQSLTFRITTGPALTGLVVGVVITTIFGFLPTLAAGQVRPALVLRPSETIMPQAGQLRSLAALIIVIAALSLVAQPLIGDLLDEPTIRLISGGTGAVLGGLLAVVIGGLLGLHRLSQLGLASIGGAAAGFTFGFSIPVIPILVATFLIIGVLYILLWTLIWLVGRFFPAMGLVDLKVALRAMVVTRGRGASTLLALVIGVFTLSLITMLTTAISNRFEELLVDEMGGNVIIFASAQGDNLGQIETTLADTDGVHSYSALSSYSVELVALEDASSGQTVTYDELQARVDAALDMPEFGPGHRQGELSQFTSTIDARSVDSNLPEVDFYAGRQLDANDAGQPHIVIAANDATLAAGFDVSDSLVFRLIGGAQPVDISFEIVGMVDRTGNQIQVGAASPNYAPVDAFPAGLEPDTVNAIVDVAPANIGDLRRALNDIPGVFMMETRLLNDLVNRVIDQFSSFPMLVASLALVVGGIVIANSVALSTLERRREIGIMKAIGVQRERVLSMLLLENGLMGLIGGLIGVGIGSLCLLLLLTLVFGGNLGSSIPYLTALSLMAMCVVIALLAAIVSVWGASGEKPLNVLRYE